MAKKSNKNNPILVEAINVDSMPNIPSDKKLAELLEAAKKNGCELFDVCILDKDKNIDGFIQMVLK